ncbi:MAG: glycine betaine ABC transporter substrate-binding protein [bacterium]
MIDLFIEEFSFFFELTIEHLSICMTAILFATLIGGLLGIILHEFKRFSNIILGIISILYTIPAISLLGFLIPFSGIGNTTAIIALSIYALLPMVRNTFVGLNSVDYNLVEAGNAMGSTKMQLLYKIKIPLALPVIFSGFKNMVVMTIALGGIASFIGAGGLGVAIYRGITTNNSNMTIIGSVLIAFLALFFDLILSMISKIKFRKINKKLLISITTLILLVSCIPLISLKTYDINIASKPMTEQYILTEMLKLVIEEETDLKVKLTQGVGGGTSNIHPAMLSGDFDIYPEYTGTAWNAVLNEESFYTEELFNDLSNQYKENFNFEFIGMYGFNNTYGIAVRKEVAELYSLKTYSDLAYVSNNLIFGAEYDFFGRLDGYEELCNSYNMNFKSTKDMDIGLKYQAINNKDIDVMNIFTTDGLLSVSDIIVLEDDLNLYPSYKCINIINSNTLLKYPQLSIVLNKFENLISDEDISNLNYKVEYLNELPASVAYNFLVERGVIHG